MRRKSRWLAALLALVLVTALVITAGGCSLGKKKTVIRIATHWGEGYQEKLLPFIEEYEKLNPDIDIQYESAPFEEYFKKIQVSALSGEAPDIYHVYSLWGVQLKRAGALDKPSPDVVNFVRNEYVDAGIKGVTIDGEVWGIPTEIDNYMLLYNKKLLAEAGYTAPPRTWDELYNMAKKITRYNQDGTIDVAGVAFMKGWDSAVVHPFLSLLMSNGGKFMNEDLSKTLIDSPEAIETLEFENKLFKDKVSDPGIDFWKLFPAGKVAMIIMAPFWEDGLKSGMGENFKDVGVAPVPYGKAGKPASAAYTWFYAVNSKSKVKDEAWKFLMWLNSAREGSKASRMGDFLVKIGIIPARIADVEAHPAELGDDFTKPFVDALPYSTVEPNIPQGQEIKTTLMQEIEESWYGKKTAEQALKAAAEKINKILSESK